MSNAEVKAHRLARSGAVSILAEAGGVVEAEVVGDTGIYQVTLSAQRGPTCTCVAATFGSDCSHIRAVWLYMEGRKTP